MIEVSYLREQEKVKTLPKEVQDTILGIVQILDTTYGANKDKYQHDEGYVIVVEKNRNIYSKALKCPTTNFNYKTYKSLQI